ncbi:MAG: tetratricopeptide repeat protein [Pyrinomonadaceae bacterium]
MEAMFTMHFKRSTLFCLIVIGALVVSVAAQQPSRKDIRRSNQLVEQGNRAFNQKNYKTAIDRYAEAIVLVPRNPAAHYWKGYAHYYLKEYPVALSELNLAEAQGHPAVDVSKVRWYLNYELKNFDAALADVNRGLQADPNDQMLLRASGDLNFEKQNYREALDSYQKAVLGSPNDGNLYYSIARVQLALGDVKGQEAAASAAVTKPNQFIGDAYYLLADALHKQRKYVPAIDAYNRALASKPDTIQIYRSLGDIYRGQSRFEEAIDVTRRALRIWPQDGNLYTDISWYYSLAGKHQEAVETAQSAVKLLPNQYMGYTNLCRAYNDLGQFQFAVTACNNALRLNPNDGETHFYLGRAYRELGRTADATRSFDKAVTGLIKFTQDNPDYSDGFYLLGNAYFNDSQFDKALAAYKRSLELSPNFTRARYNSAISHLRLNNKVGAMEQYNALVSLDSDLASRLKAEIDKMP